MQGRVGEGGDQEEDVIRDKPYNEGAGIFCGIITKARDLTVLGVLVKLTVITKARNVAVRPSTIFTKVEVELELEDEPCAQQAKHLGMEVSDIIVKARDVAMWEEPEELGIITKARDMAVDEELKEIRVITKARDVAVCKELVEIIVITKVKEVAVSEELEDIGVITKARNLAGGRRTIITKARDVAVCEELKEICGITKARNVAVDEELEEISVITKARDVAVCKELVTLVVINKARVMAVSETLEEIGVITKARNVAGGRRTSITKVEAELELEDEPWRSRPSILAWRCPTSSPRPGTWLCVRSWKSSTLSLKLGMWP